MLGVALGLEHEVNIDPESVSSKKATKLFTIDWLFLPIVACDNLSVI